MFENKWHIRLSLSYNVKLHLSKYSDIDDHLYVTTSNFIVSKNSEIDDNLYVTTSNFIVLKIAT